MHNVCFDKITNISVKNDDDHWYIGYFSSYNFLGMKTREKRILYKESKNLQSRRCTPPNIVDQEFQ